MAMVRDPQFWRRFSVAVHQDEEDQKRPELKHRSYVDPVSSTPASPSPAYPAEEHQQPQYPLQQQRQSRTPATATSPTNPFSPASPSLSIYPRTPTHPSPTPSRQPSLLRKPPPAAKPKPKNPIYTRRNTSALSLGLSGRPNSRFNFWTHITADPSRRESWLEEQRRKKSKRTCMCWGFWLVFAALIAAIVVTILLLRSKGII